MIIAATQQEHPMTPRRYRKRPIEVEAIQWDGTAEGATVVIDWVLSGGGTARYHPPSLHSEACLCDGRGFVPGPLGGPLRSVVPCFETKPTGTPYIAIDTPDATGRIFEGDWAIRGPQGDHYPCRGDIFTTTYEPAEEAR